MKKLKILSFVHMLKGQNHVFYAIIIINNEYSHDFFSASYVDQGNYILSGFIFAEMPL